MSSSLLNRSTQLYNKLGTNQLKSISTNHRTNIILSHYNKLNAINPHNINSQLQSRQFSSPHSTSNAASDIQFHPPTDLFNKYAGTVLFSIMWFWVFINWYACYYSYCHCQSWHIIVLPDYTILTHTLIILYEGLRIGMYFLAYVIHLSIVVRNMMPMMMMNSIISIIKCYIGTIFEHIYAIVWLVVL